MLERITNALLNNQNPDGGWGATKSKRSNTEASSFAVAALRALAEPAAAEPLRRGVAWLTAHQNQDGSWQLNDVAKEGSWTTALAILALNNFPENQSAVTNAARWLLRQEGSKPGILAQLVLFVTGKTKVNEVNQDLIGWSWVPNSFSWVEPTSYALIALKKTKAQLADTNVDDRIRQGESMVYDRMCKDGGWNYGNAKVLDYALWPYPDITAIALIALQDRSAERANQVSLHVLDQIARQTDSGLALCWGAICLIVYGRDSSPWNKAIEDRFQKTRFLDETKPLALALLALNRDASPFRI